LPLYKQLVPDDSTVQTSGTFGSSDTIYSALTTSSSSIWPLRAYKNKIVKTIFLNKNYCYCWNVAVPTDNSS